MLNRKQGMAWMTTGLLIVGLGTVGGTMGGCASSGEQRAKVSVGAIDSVSDVRMQVERGLDLLDRATGSLQQLNDPKINDLRKPFSVFSADVKRVEATAEGVRKRVQSMRARTEDYFASWSKQNQSLNAPGLQRQGNARLVEARASFDRVNAALQEGKVAFAPLMEDLLDVKAFLAHDLTAAGRVAVGPMIESAIKRAGVVRGSLETVKSELTRFEAELSPVMPAAESAPAASDAQAK